MWVQAIAAAAAAIASFAICLIVYLGFQKAHNVLMLRQERIQTLAMELLHISAEVNAEVVTIQEQMGESQTNIGNRTGKDLVYTVLVTAEFKNRGKCPVQIVGTKCMPSYGADKDTPSPLKGAMVSAYSPSGATLIGWKRLKAHGDSKVLEYDLLAQARIRAEGHTEYQDYMEKKYKAEKQERGFIAPQDSLCSVEIIDFGVRNWA